MKNTRKFLSIVLALMMILGCLPFSCVVLAEEAAEDTEYVIFKTNPSSIGKDNDATAISQSSSYFTSHTNVTVKEEAGKLHYSATENFDGIADYYNRAIYFKSGYTDKQLGWLNDLKTLNALVGLMNVNVEYRITTENFEQGDVHFMLGAAQAYTGKNKYTTAKPLVDVWSKTWGDWTTASATPTQSHTQTIYSGFIGFKTEFPKNEECTVTTDIRDVTFTIKESNRDAIDAALTAAGSTWTFDTLIDYFFVDTEYIIFKTNPITIGAGGDATATSASSSYFTSYSQVFVEEEDDRLHYTSIEEFDGTAGHYNRTKYFFGGYTNNQLGWLSDLNTINALVGFMRVNVEYRITTENFEQGDVHFMLGTANAYTKKNQYTTYDSATGKSPALVDVWSKSWGDWTTASVTPTAKHSQNLYSGFFGFKTEMPKNEECTVTTDIRKVTFTLRKSDRKAINEALAAAGSTWTFDTLIEYFYDENNNPYADVISNDTIWYANPDKLATENNADITLDKDSASTIPFYTQNRTYRVSDEDGSYYRSVMDTSGAGGNTKTSTAMFASGITKDTAGYGWLSNKELLTALAPYMYISAETRFEGAIPNGGSNSIIINGINSDSYVFISYLPITSAGQWMETKLSAIQMKKENFSNGGTYFYDDWSDGQIGLAIYSYNSVGGFSGTQKIDVRNLRMEFMGKDRAAINAALAEVSGIDNIENFTKGVELGLDAAGNKDYYSLFVSAPKGKDFDINDDDNVSVLDLIRLKKYVAYSVYVPELMAERADTNKDGFYDSDDLVAMSQKLLVG